VIFLKLFFVKNFYIKKMSTTLTLKNFEPTDTLRDFEKTFDSQYNITTIQFRKDWKLEFHPHEYDDEGDVYFFFQEKEITTGLIRKLKKNGNITVYFLNESTIMVVSEEDKDKKLILINGCDNHNHIQGYFFHFFVIIRNRHIFLLQHKDTPVCIDSAVVQDDGWGGHRFKQTCDSNSLMNNCARNGKIEYESIMIPNEDQNEYRYHTNDTQVCYQALLTDEHSYNLQFFICVNDTHDNFESIS
jgi:hypothetical protein